MPGVLFVVCVPTANFEHILIYGAPPKTDPANRRSGDIKIDVELRDKNQAPVKQRTVYRHNEAVPSARRNPPPVPLRRVIGKSVEDDPGKDVPMEKVLDELLKKLKVEHVVWCGDKNGNYYEVFFPVSAGDPCENLLHCLTELGIGKKFNSIVSVLPCSVVYNGMDDEVDKEEVVLRTAEDNSKWNNFVESIRSKLTVKQVVDGVRSGGQLSFDYLLLIVTADSLAALGLVENNASNIVAAMLVSPLMGPVMSITFAAIISDKELIKVGFISLITGMLISCIFGFIFGLILGSTDMPWGFGDWPTEEMKGRGNARSLWMGVLWALTSGTGVAVALLQGSAGPLIGVAISASLLPPVVNCGLYWALACIWLLHKDKGIKIPHIKGENYTGISSYQPIYSDYLPIEFAVNGIVSACLTVVNVICIFITAIIVLKIKEVAAPYTSSPELKRFWERDIPVVRRTNRSTIRRTVQADKKEFMSSFPGVSPENLEQTVEAALCEAVDDDTFRKVKRISYSPHATEEVHQQLGISPRTSRPLNPLQSSTLRNSTLNDLAALDKLITSLLGSQPRSSPILNRFRPLSRSLRHGSTTNRGSNTALPTILEGGPRNNGSARTLSWSERAVNTPGVRNVLQTIANVPHRLSTSENSEETTNLTGTLM